MPVYDDIVNGSIVKFRTINEYDLTTFSGTVIGFVEYAGATAFSGSNSLSILPYHKQVLQTYTRRHAAGTLPAGTVDLPILQTECNYILLSTIGSDGSTRIYPIAKEWIDISTLQFSSARQVALLRVESSKDIIDELIASARNKGAFCTVVSRS